jgi:hypothetical protein
VKIGLGIASKNTGLDSTAHDKAARGANEDGREREIPSSGDVRVQDIRPEIWRCCKSEPQDVTATEKPGHSRNTKKRRKINKEKQAGYLFKRLFVHAIALGRCRQSPRSDRFESSFKTNPCR